MEMLLVLCLVVILGTMAWPLLERPMANERLRKAADQVRTHWCSAGEGDHDGARVRVQLHAGRRTLCGAIAGDSGVRARGGLRRRGGVRDGSDGRAGGVPAGGAPPAGEDFLPGRRDQGRYAPAAIDATAVPLDGEMAMAAPIFFYPDGTTSSAVLQLRNEHGAVIEIVLRGLTGVASVGPVQPGGVMP